MNQQLPEVIGNSLYNIDYEWPVRVYRKLLPVTQTGGGEDGGGARRYGTQADIGHNGDIIQFRVPIDIADCCHLQYCFMNSMQAQHNI